MRLCLSCVPERVKYGTALKRIFSPNEFFIRSIVVSNEATYSSRKLHATCYAVVRSNNISVYN